MYIYGIYCITQSEVSTCDLEVLQVPAPLPHSAGSKGWQGVARGGKEWQGVADALQSLHGCSTEWRSSCQSMQHAAVNRASE